MKNHWIFSFQWTHWKITWFRCRLRSLKSLMFHSNLLQTLLRRLYSLWRSPRPPWWFDTDAGFASEVTFYCWLAVGLCDGPPDWFPQSPPHSSLEQMTSLLNPFQQNPKHYYWCERKNKKCSSQREPAGRVCLTDVSEFVDWCMMRTNTGGVWHAGRNAHHILDYNYYYLRGHHMT